MTHMIAFFNNKGGVGKTSLVYHLAWMYRDLGRRVLAVDLDPQANLTAAFLAEEVLEDLWLREPSAQTVYACVRPLVRGTGDVAPADLQPIDDGLALLAGDLALTGFEDELSQEWPRCMDGIERSFRVISAFWRIVHQAAEGFEADLTLMDLGPNLGAINRAALIAADHVVIPLAPDLFSLQGLTNLGPTFRRWRTEWQDRRSKNPAPDLPLPAGEMRPAGYIVMQHGVRLDRPVKAYERWIARIPGVYREAVMADRNGGAMTVENDPHCLALLKHYRSLMPLAQEARKPMFLLKPADGAIGAHVQAVQSAHADFRILAETIASRIGASSRSADPQS